MTSVFKGKGSDIEFQDCDHDYGGDSEYVCFECSVVQSGTQSSPCDDGNAWIKNPLDAVEHIRKHIERGDMVPNKLIAQLQETVKQRSFVHQSLMSPGRRCDGSRSGEREKAFHDEWSKEQSKAFRTDPLWASLFRSWDIDKPTTREIAIMASLVEWFGTNVGFCFLENALKRCGYRIVPIDEKGKVE